MAHAGYDDAGGVGYRGGGGAAGVRSNERVALAVQDQGGDVQRGQAGSPVAAGEDRCTLACACGGIESAAAIHEVADVA